MAPTKKPTGGIVQIHDRKRGQHPKAPEVKTESFIDLTTAAQAEEWFYRSNKELLQRDIDSSQVADLWTDELTAQIEIAGEQLERGNGPGTFNIRSTPLPGITPLPPEFISHLLRRIVVISTMFDLDRDAINSRLLQSIDDAPNRAVMREFRGKP